MPAPQFQSDNMIPPDAAVDAAVRADRFQTELDACAPVATEPRRLQGEIESRWMAPKRRDVRWSLRQTIAFCLLTCGTFWAVSIYGFLNLVA